MAQRIENILVPLPCTLREWRDDIQVGGFTAMCLWSNDLCIAPVGIRHRGEGGRYDVVAEDVHIGHRRQQETPLQGR